MASASGCFQSFPIITFLSSSIQVLLNWSGLIVNGAVAFILPLVLTLYTYSNGSNNVKGPLIESGMEASDQVDVVYPLPLWLEGMRWYILIICIVAFSSIIVGTFVLDLASGTEPS